MKTPAERYGKLSEALSDAARELVRSVGESLAKSGVVQQETLGNPSMPTEVPTAAPTNDSDPPRRGRSL